ncbi:phytoene/squalene synthase family protein [Erythrobacter sp. LQ02-29]|uniref:phytoene/squalene synthase family protein n=1 Tax=Erythrobacter sp. LQ02-29 TaxID=2920384 RepID=UPI001F4E7CD2|nr:phytoene/squalene synthase family protein [Erythrobacter sp. LQ02-29]MCP9221334.1 phytoene/squalene synthase family protein [Erythrobacter sp. LQ02-29]
MNQPRPLAPSRFVRGTPAAAGGGRDRDRLVEKSRAAIAEGSASFTTASRLFDRTTREQVWMLYAWCRRCDDLADNQDMGGDLGEQKDIEDRVQAIRVLTRRALERQPTADFAFDALGQVASETGITKDMADDVIGGFAMDAGGFDAKGERDMLRYCYHVAGAVGVMMARVMRAPDDSFVYDRACDLGIAFQLANIARDIAQDGAAGRNYLPEQWLEDAGLTPDNYLEPENRFALAAVSARLVDLMETYEASARLGAARLRFRQRWAVLAAARIYGAIGRKVRDRGQLAWDSRTRIGKPGKLRHLLAAFGEALVNRPRPPHTWPEYTRGELRPIKGW